jgi:hypothetical protein
VTAADCLKQMSDRYALFQTLWNMYFVASFGVLAFLASAKFHDSARLWWAKGGAILAYGCFAYSNLGGLRRVRNEHDLLGAAFSKLAGKEGGTDPDLAELEKGLARYRQLPAERLLVATYVLGCVLVVVLLLLIPPTQSKARQEHAERTYQRQGRPLSGHEKPEFFIV